MFMGNQLKRNATAGGVVLNTKGEVLVVNQNGDSWSLPKGHLEEGETALEAAKREIYEESGVSKLTYVKDFGTYERYRIKDGGRGEDKRKLKSITLFLFTTMEEKLAPIDPSNPEARWVEKNKVAELLTHPKDKEFFTSILSELNEV